MNFKLIYLSISLYYFITIVWSAIAGDYYADFLQQNDYSLFVYYEIKLLLAVIVLVVQIVEIIKDPWSYMSASKARCLDDENKDFISNYIALKIMIFILLGYDIIYRIVKYSYS